MYNKPECRERQKRESCADKLSDWYREFGSQHHQRTVTLNSSFGVDLSSCKDQSKANSKELYFRSQKENVLAKCKTQKKNQSVRSSEKDIIEKVATTPDLCSAHLIDACAQNREGSIKSTIETKCTTYQTAEKERNCKMLRMNESKESLIRKEYQMAVTDWDKRLSSASDIITVNRAALNNHAVGRFQSKGQSERSYYLAQQRKFVAKSKTQENNQNVTKSRKEECENAAAMSNNYSMPLKDSYTKNKESSKMLCSELKYTASNNVEIEPNDRMVNVNKTKEGANQIKSQLCSNILDEHMSPVSDRTSPSRDEALGGNNDVPLCPSKQPLEAQSRDCHKSVTATEQRHPRTNWTQSMTSNPINKKSKKYQLRERTERQECQNVDETNYIMNQRKCPKSITKGAMTLNSSFVVDLSSSKDQSKAKSKELYIRSQKENVLATCKTQNMKQSVRVNEKDIIEKVATTQDLCSAHLIDACAHNKEGSITSTIKTKCTTYQTAEKERNCETLRMNESKESLVRIKYQMATNDWDKRRTSASDIITVNRAALNDHAVGRFQSKGQSERSYYLAQQRKFVAKRKTQENNQNVTKSRKEECENAAAMSNNYSMPLKDSYTKNKESSKMLCSELKYTASNNVEIEPNDRMVQVYKMKEGASQIKSQLCSNILDEHMSPVSERTSPSRDEALGGNNDVPLCSSKYQQEAQSRNCHKSVTATEQRHPRTNWTQSMTSNPINKKSKKYQLRERTERQECQNVDETSYKVNQRKCPKSNVIRRRHCRSHSNREVATLERKNDVGKFKDLADYWNQKPRRRNRIRDLNHLDLKVIILDWQHKRVCRPLLVIECRLPMDTLQFATSQV
ncbi:hypothetical protein BSL78_09872 [Apostichopus japonicus]|uniref:Uncharacterized protein n=1 Tax=Stichopus japonicus TaxID=307972 RepID=A0A2G8KYY8_STIJA|nr:hypothetical protein BSL78_09872 [Apostichopus japonicus]